MNLSSTLSFGRAASLPALLFACLLVSARGISAQIPEVLIPTLEGVTFQNSTVPPEKLTCDPNAGQMDFAVRGTATPKPYTGEFLETGTLFFDPKTGQITGGKIEFTISDSAGKIVVGTKIPTDGVVQCTVDPKAGIFTFSVSVPSLTYTADLLASMTKDEGQATLDFSGSTDNTTKPPTTRIQFTEVFHSSNVVRSTPGKVTGGGTVVQGDNKKGITFGFNAQNTDQGMKGSGTIIDHITGVKVQILEIETFAISGTHATFTGKAEVNGKEEKFRIDVDDLGEPGASLDSFKIVTDSYVGGGTLTGGNIQVHQ